MYDFTPNNFENSGYFYTTSTYGILCTAYTITMVYTWTFPQL